MNTMVKRPLLLLNFTSLYTGSVGLSWFVFWLYFGFSSPATHPRITEAEKRYIESSIAESSLKHEDGNGKVQKNICAWWYITTMLTSRLE